MIDILLIYLFVWFLPTFVGMIILVIFRNNELTIKDLFEVLMFSASFGPIMWGICCAEQIMNFFNKLGQIRIVKPIKARELK